MGNVSSGGRDTDNDDEMPSGKLGNPNPNLNTTFSGQHVFCVYTDLQINDEVVSYLQSIHKISENYDITHIFVTTSPATQQLNYHSQIFKTKTSRFNEIYGPENRYKLSIYHPLVFDDAKSYLVDKDQYLRCDFFRGSMATVHDHSHQIRVVFEDSDIPSNDAYDVAIRIPTTRTATAEEVPKEVPKEMPATTETELPGTHTEQDNIIIDNDHIIIEDIDIVNGNEDLSANASIEDDDDSVKSTPKKKNKFLSLFKNNTKDSLTHALDNPTKNILKDTGTTDQPPVTIVPYTATTASSMSTSPPLAAQTTSRVFVQPEQLEIRIEDTSNGAEIKQFNLFETKLPSIKFRAFRFMCTPNAETASESYAGATVFGVLFPTSYAQAISFIHSNIRFTSATNIIYLVLLPNKTYTFLHRISPQHASSGTLYTQYVTNSKNAVVQSIKEGFSVKINTFKYSVGHTPGVDVSVVFNAQRKLEIRQNVFFETIVSMTPVFKNIHVPAVTIIRQPMPFRVHTDIADGFVSVYPSVTPDIVYNFIHKWDQLKPGGGFFIQIFKYSGDLPMQITNYMKTKQIQSIVDKDFLILFPGTLQPSTPSPPTSSYIIPFPGVNITVQFFPRAPVTNSSADLAITGTAIGKETSVTLFPCTMFRVMNSPSVEELRDVKKYANTCTTVSVQRVDFDLVNKNMVPENLFCVLQRNMTPQQLGDWLKNYMKLDEARQVAFALIMLNVTDEAYNSGRKYAPLAFKFTARDTAGTTGVNDISQLMYVGTHESCTVKFTESRDHVLISIVLPATGAYSDLKTEAERTWSLAVYKEFTANNEYVVVNTSADAAIPIKQLTNLPNTPMPAALKKTNAEYLLVNNSLRSGVSDMFAKNGKAHVFWAKLNQAHYLTIEPTISQYIKSKNTTIYSYIRNMPADVIDVLPENLDRVATNMSARLVFVFYCKITPAALAVYKTRWSNFQFTSLVQSGLTFIVLTNRGHRSTITAANQNIKISVVPTDAESSDEDRVKDERILYICRDIMSVPETDIDRRVRGIFTIDLFVPPPSQVEEWDHRLSPEYVYKSMDLDVLVGQSSLFQELPGLILCDPDDIRTPDTPIAAFEDLERYSQTAQIASGFHCPPLPLLQALKKLVQAKRLGKKPDPNFFAGIIFNVTGLSVGRGNDFRFRVSLLELVAYITRTTQSPNVGFEPREEPTDAVLEERKKWKLLRLNANTMLLSNMVDSYIDHVLRLTWFYTEDEKNNRRKEYSYPIHVCANKSTGHELDMFRIELSLESGSFDNSCFSEMARKEQDKFSLDGATHVVHILKLTTQQKFKETAICDAKSADIYKKYQSDNQIQIAFVLAGKIDINTAKSMVLCLYDKPSKQHMLEQYVGGREIEWARLNYVAPVFFKIVMVLCDVQTQADILPEKSLFGVYDSKFLIRPHLAQWGPRNEGLVRIVAGSPYKILCKKGAQDKELIKKLYPDISINWYDGENVFSEVKINPRFETFLDRWEKIDGFMEWNNHPTHCDHYYLSSGGSLVLPQKKYSGRCGLLCILRMPGSKPEPVFALQPFLSVFDFDMHGVILGGPKDTIGELPDNLIVENLHPDNATLTKYTVTNAKFRTNLSGDIKHITGNRYLVPFKNSLFEIIINNAETEVTTDAERYVAINKSRRTYDAVSNTGTFRIDACMLGNSQEFIYMFIDMLPTADGPQKQKDLNIKISHLL